MAPARTSPITIGAPNWTLLETVVSPLEGDDYMYIGRAGQIELYKHVLTRRYLNISHDGRRFYRRERDGYIEISKTEALDYVRH